MTPTALGVDEDLIPDAGADRLPAPAEDAGGEANGPQLATKSDSAMTARGLKPIPLD